ncbi:MAG TPA: hypothetical protein VIR33_14245 [Thermopolyspora sp.]|jgi:hypothetical protein
MTVDPVRAAYAARSRHAENLAAAMLGTHRPDTDAERMLADAVNTEQADQADQATPIDVTTLTYEDLGRWVYHQVQREAEQQ